MTARRQGTDAGFSAIELMVVIGVAILLAAITIPTIAGMMRSSRLTSSANSCAAMVRTARTMAIASSSVYCFQIDAADDPVVVGVYDGADNCRSEARLEDGIAAAASHAGRLEFQPDGSARLADDSVPKEYFVQLSETEGRKRYVRVKGLTGRVKVTQVTKE